MQTPAEKVFAWHFVGERVILQDPRTLKYYDHSYGIAANNAADYTAKTIAGWGKELPDGVVHYRKRVPGETVKFLVRP